MIKNSTKLLGGALLMGLVSIGHAAAAPHEDAGQYIALGGFSKSIAADTTSGQRIILARFGGGIANSFNEQGLTGSSAVTPASKFEKTDDTNLEKPVRHKLKRFIGFPK